MTTVDIARGSRSQWRSRWPRLALAAAFAALAALLAWTVSDNRAVRSENATLREEAATLREALAAAPRRPADPSAAALPAPQSAPVPAGRATDALAARAVRPEPAPAGGPFEEALKAQREAASRAGSSPFGRP